MADPTESVNLVYSQDLGIDRPHHQIKSAEALVPGGHISLDISTAKQEFSKAGANLLPQGFVVGQSRGDNTNLTGNSAGDYSSIAKGGILVEVAVTGASAVTDATKLVYATDGQTFTLTRPSADAVPVGMVVRWKTSTTCVVHFFTMLEAAMFSMIPIKSRLDLGNFPTNALQGNAAAELITDLPMHGHFTIDSLHAICVGHDNAAVAGDQNLNLEIGSTNTTGGVLNLLYTHCDAVGDMGAILDASAITAENEVHDGDLISLEMAASGTGFTADVAAAFKIYADITYLPGA